MLLNAGCPFVRRILSFGPPDMRLDEAGGGSGRLGGAQVGGGEE